MDSFIEILKIILPALAVFAASYFTVKHFLDNDRHRRDQEARRTNQSTITPLRLQAYERLVIFLERINPNTLIVRVSKQGMNAHQLHLELIKTVKTEYEHNLSQQIYMSHGAWELIRTAKEEIIKIINITATKVPYEAPGNELAMTILDITSNLGKKLPNEVALEFIKREVSTLY